MKIVIAYPRKSGAGYRYLAGWTKRPNSRLRYGCTIACGDGATGLTRDDDGHLSEREARNAALSFSSEEIAEKYIPRLAPHTPDAIRSLGIIDAPVVISVR